MSVIYTSSQLIPGEIYTRKQLVEQFQITDSTINTGVFRPKGSQSLWLFITEQKTPDRTDYKDLLSGDLLKWDGQTQGRTDALIIEHRQRGLELLVFYRHSKKAHPGAGFCFEGTFEYLDHHGSHPTQFTLQRQSTYSGIRELEHAAYLAEQQGIYDAEDETDARQRVTASIVRRQGQPAFRRALLDAYGGCCVITGCSLEPVLEAAHIQPYRGAHTHHVSNGLLLRADIHTLFDLYLLGVAPDTRAVHLANTVGMGEYEMYRTKTLRAPQNPEHRPNPEALRKHWISGNFP